MKPAYEMFATAACAYRNCVKSNNTEWRDKWEARADDLTGEVMPSGGGFDNGTTFDIEASDANKLVFHTAFHHMNEMGFYDGWTEHRVTVKPSFIHGFDICLSGQGSGINKNNVKGYIAEVFSYALNRMVDWAE